MRLSRFVSAALFLVAFSPPRESRAAWPTDPAVNLPVCTASGNQYLVFSVSDGQGGVILSWFDDRDPSIYAQRLSASGTVLWQSNGVPVCTVPGFNKEPVKMISDEEGGAIVVWTEQRNQPGIGDLYGQRLSPSGVLMWDPAGAPICTAPEYQTNPSLASDGSGGAIVVWQDQRSGVGSQVFAQRLASNGSPLWASDGIPISPGSNSQGNPKIVADGQDGGIVVMNDYVDGASLLVAQRLDPHGNRLWPEDVALHDVASDNFSFDVVTDGAAGVLVFFDDNRNSGFQLFAQRIESSGVRQWGQDGVLFCDASNSKTGPTAVADGAGGAFVTWYTDGRSADQLGRFAQRIAPDGSSAWTSNGIRFTDQSGQQPAVLAADGSGGVWLAWLDIATNDAFAQHLNAAGDRLSGDDGLLFSSASGVQSPSGIVADDAGGAIVTFWDKRNDPCAGDPPGCSHNLDLYAQRVPFDAPVPTLVQHAEAKWFTSEARIAWELSEAGGFAWNVERRRDGEAWRVLGGAIARDRVLSFVDRDVRAGERYGYRLAASGLATGEVWLDIPPARLEIASPFPNPARGGIVTLSLMLGGRGSATLEVFDVSGRRVTMRPCGPEGSARRTLELRTSTWSAGLYLVRLRQGDEFVESRLVIAR